MANLKRGYIGLINANHQAYMIKAMPHCHRNVFILLLDKENDGHENS
jgi:hypothetical protein